MGRAWRGGGRRPRGPRRGGLPGLRPRSCHRTSSPGTLLLFNVCQFCGSRRESLGLSLLIRLRVCYQACGLLVSLSMKYFLYFWPFFLFETIVCPFLKWFREVFLYFCTLICEFFPPRFGHLWMNECSWLLNLLLFFPSGLCFLCKESRAKPLGQSSMT